MRRNLFITVIAVGAALLAPQSASAQSPSLVLVPASLVPTGVPCTNSLQATMGYTSCSGAWDGNNKGNSARQLSVSNALFAFDGFTVLTQSSNDDPLITPFSNASANGLTSGTISFNSMITGPFVLALKTSTAFSLFYYRNLPVNGVNFVNFTTDGVSVKNNGPQALSHATLYRGSIRDVPPPNVVPEPSTYALMATGLIGLVGFARRRRQA